MYFLCFSQIQGIDPSHSPAQGQNSGDEGTALWSRRGHGCKESKHIAIWRFHCQRRSVRLSCTYWLKKYFKWNKSDYNIQKESTLKSIIKLVHAGLAGVTFSAILFPLRSLSRLRMKLWQVNLRSRNTLPWVVWTVTVIHCYSGKRTGPFSRDWLLWRGNIWQHLVLASIPSAFSARCPTFTRINDPALSLTPLKAFSSFTTIWSESDSYTDPYSYSYSRYFLDSYSYSRYFLAIRYFIQIINLTRWSHCIRIK